MSAQACQFNTSDGNKQLALASPEADGNGCKVVIFPEGDIDGMEGGYAIKHNVQWGTEPGTITH